MVQKRCLVLEKIIKVILTDKKKSHDIVVAEKEDLLFDFLEKNGALGGCAIICDSSTEKLFGERFESELLKRKVKAHLFSFPQGEESKNLGTVENLMNGMLERDFGRKSVLVAVGGGVVGDVGGFVAATYMRGIPFVNVPTTFLAMIDSSIGGKVGVDLSGGKNSCGAFHQPELVFINPDYLKSLPEKEMRNGLAEAIKYGAMFDEKLFSFIERNLEKIYSKDRKVLVRIIKDCCRIKANVVMKDEKESNLRKTLNFGHTVGHAMESLTHYKKYSHGEAVAAGMNLEAVIAEKLCGFPTKDALRLREILLKAGFKLDLPELGDKMLIGFMGKDKKNVSGKIVFSVPKKIGSACSVKGKYGIGVDAPFVERVLFA